MRKHDITLEVLVLDAADLEGVNEEARVRGKLQERAAEIALLFPGNPSVTLGMKPAAKGRVVPYATVAGHQLLAGDGVAVHPMLPGGSVKVPAELIASLEAARPKVAKKATKKAA